MYTFSSKLKTLSFILMAVGILGIGYGFLTAPKDIQDIEKIIAAESHGGYGEAKQEATTSTEDSHEAVAKHNDDAVEKKMGESHEAVVLADDTTKAVIATSDEPTHVEMAVKKSGGHVISEEEAHTEHLNHVLHQLQNKPWAALYVACIFFMLISLGVLAFYAIQQVSQSGWSPVLFRVMQGITAYLPVGSVLFFIFLLLCGFHLNHLLYG